MTVGAPAPGTSQEQARSSLRVTPGVYVAGQKMTFTGTIGGRSRKTVRLQFHMNRPGRPVDRRGRVQLPDGRRGAVQVRGRGRQGPHHLVPLDGRPIATVKSRAAVSDLPLTLRMSMQGTGQTDMNRTRAMYDWMRAWPIDTGRRLTGGNGMQVGTHGASC